MKVSHTVNITRSSSLLVCVGIPPVISNRVRGNEARGGAK